MAVINTKEDWSKRKFFKGTFAQLAERGFTVLLDGNDSYPDEVASRATGIPVAGEAHPAAGFLRVADIKANPIGPNLYMVMVLYRKPDTGGDARVTDPYSVPPIRTLSTSSVEEEIDQDFNQKAIANTAGDPYDPPVTRRVADLVYTVTRNESSLASEQKDEYINTVNETPFGPFGKGKCLLADIRSVESIEGGINFFRTTYEVHIRTRTLASNISKTWYARILNAGPRQRKQDASGNWAIKHIIDPDTGAHTTRPLPLDQDGVHIVDPKEAQLVWNEYELYPFKSWNALLLPAPT